MPFAETPLRDEYAAAVERMARRTLDALRDAGGAASGAGAYPEPDGLLASLLTDPDGTVPTAVLAAARVLGVDLFAPRLLRPDFSPRPGFPSDRLDEPTARLLAEARRVFPPPAAADVNSTDSLDSSPQSPSADACLVIAWQDWAVSALLVRTADGVRAYGGDAVQLPAAVPHPSPRPGQGPNGWQTWSVRMAQLSSLALPGLDGPVHDLARAHTLDLARGATRSMLRRDLRTATRLARWLAWARADGRPLRLEVEPVLERIRLTGDGSARTLLELAIAERLLAGPTALTSARPAP
ncbi:hypothetical protein [Kitasatospora sp. NPDC093558]|uniref:hypothetical protein n=1 Tax=Kitasatospora sp. NPDC093558 TaxID=3155201 RepID=UPI00344A14D7